MTYSVKEIFYTLQGEGAHAGRAAVFCRFSGCNFWSGLERDREKAICNFCDTDFIGINGQNGGKFKTAEELALTVKLIWNEGVEDDNISPFIVCTGGEPLLQLDQALIEALHVQGFEIAIESNGSMTCPEGVDWICISPKSLEHFEQKSGHELKLVYPQEGLEPSLFEDLDFEHFYLQPKDEEGRKDENTRAVIDYCMKQPKWRLSLQSHKILGID